MSQPTIAVKRRYRHSEHGRAKRRAWYEANREKALALERVRQYRIRYGITVAQYEALLLQQWGRCAICLAAAPSSTGKRAGDKYHHRYFAVDHNHDTGVVRGLLCVACNVALGKIEGWYAKHQTTIAAYLSRGKQ